MTIGYSDSELYDVYDVRKHAKLAPYRRRGGGQGVDKVAFDETEEEFERRTEGRRGFHYQERDLELDDFYDASPRVDMFRSAMKGYVRLFKINVFSPGDLTVQLWHSKLEMYRMLMGELNRFGPFKFMVSVSALLFKPADSDEGVKFTTVYYNSTPRVVMTGSDLIGVDLAVSEMLALFGRWVSGGSGWVLSDVQSHHINVADYVPLLGTSYMELPPGLKGKKSVINVRNEDDKCFMWCHLASISGVKRDRDRVSKYAHLVGSVDYTGVEFPVKSSQYKLIERLNKMNVNVFSYGCKRGGGTYPVFVSDQSYDTELNLLLLTKGGDSHYVLITDFDKFMYGVTKSRTKRRHCMRCLQRFSSVRILDKHKEVCKSVNGVQRVTMPEDGSVVKFSGHSKGVRAPFAIYADFEAILAEPKDPVSTDTDWTKKTKDHICCGYAYKVVCTYDEKYSKPVELFRGPGAAKKFLHRMLEEAKYCARVRRSLTKRDMYMSKAEVVEYGKSEECYVCGLAYTDMDPKTRGFCKADGSYISAVHRSCVKSLEMTDRIPVIFHNLRGYDSHFIMQEIGSFGMEVGVIPNNMERYMSFTLGKQLCFIDSFQFMSSGLDGLVKNLQKDELRFTSEVFSEGRLDLVSRKGVYPYDYMNDWKKMDQTYLPAREHFYNELTSEAVSDSDYAHAERVWDEFDIETMGEYHDLYLKTDVLLLADVFENFRRACMSSYGLDPCNYYTSPGLAWDAMLKMTKVELELLSDVDMLQFVERGLRGGVSTISHRYGSANNKYMSSHNDLESSRYIMYLDANNLYGWAMNQFLPTGKFRWLSRDEIAEFSVDAYKDTTPRGCILEVDLEYPESLHDLHNGLPLAPEKMHITEDMLSPYCLRLMKEMGVSSGTCSKLVTTLRGKKRYVLHYRNLQLYLSLGMRLKRVRRVLEFDQSAWLSEYIMYNTAKRAQAKNAFEKDFFKLMNNSVFGKTMENIRKRVDVKLVTSEAKLASLVSKPNYVSCKIFGEDLVAVHNRKENLLMNRPTYVGMCILDISKTLIYDFHYNYIKEKYGDGSTLLFTDTDSLTYEIQTEDLYEDMKKDQHLFDNSNYSKDSPFFYNGNNKVVGKMKDETGGRPIVEFVGLRSKMYSYVYDDETGGKTAKGVKKSVVKKSIKHDDYLSVLMQSGCSGQMRHKMNFIRSSGHKLGSYTIDKVSLSCYDDKRYILPDGVTSRAYGHYML